MHAWIIIVLVYCPDLNIYEYALDYTLNQKSKFPSDTFWYNSRNI